MAAPLAEPGQRLLARVVDTLVVGIPVVLVVRELVSGHTADVVAPTAVAGCMLLYEAVQLALWGRTLGKRVAGIEVVAATAQEAPGAAAQGAGEAAGAAGPGGASAIPVSVPGFVPVTAPKPEESAPPGEAESSGAHARPDVLRCVLRAAVYSVPIGLRPIPVLGLLASIFWVVNAGAVFEGTSRQAVHDRVAGTLVVKRPRPESSAF
ncbi:MULTISPECIES: RDD family protein [unclassified Actinomadura]|uniref:RDD family protein n=1 Tax=unclassified Actinomadura TaxID=2626254 RepID=UPI001F3681E2|nr:RDD family protein [Actinomadura sp. K4S16]